MDALVGVEVEYLASLIADYCDVGLDDFTRGRIKGRVDEYLNQNDVDPSDLATSIEVGKATAMERYDSYLDGVLSQVRS